MFYLMRSYDHKAVYITEEEASSICGKAAIQAAIAKFGGGRNAVVVKMLPEAEEYSTIRRPHLTITLMVKYYPQGQPLSAWTLVDILPTISEKEMERQGAVNAADAARASAQEAHWGESFPMGFTQVKPLGGRTLSAEEEAEFYRKINDRPVEGED